MDISFDHGMPGIYSLSEAVAFPAEVNGKNIVCEISVEALKTHFGAKPPNDASKFEYDAAVLNAFEAARDRIEAVAARHLRANPDSVCLLQSEHF
jgi:hypothetical protein